MIDKQISHAHVLPQHLDSRICALKFGWGAFTFHLLSRSIDAYHSYNWTLHMFHDRTGKYLGSIHFRTYAEVMQYLKDKGYI